MPNSTITLPLGGLLLFCFDEGNRTCELKINTAIEDHVLTIKAEDSDTGGTATMTFDKNAISPLHPIQVFVADEQTLEPIGDAATKGANYDEIVDLGGSDFYNRSLNVRNGLHGCSIFIKSGTVGGGDRAMGCYRVKQELFPDLTFTTIANNIWLAYLATKQAADPESIKLIGTNFVKSGKAAISLEEGQVLRVTYGPENTDLFPPLKSGEIKINYLDTNPATSLNECIGFAHHCEALALSPAEPIFGLLHVVVEPDPAASATHFQVRTEPGCCEGGRINPPTE